MAWVKPRSRCAGLNGAHQAQAKALALGMGGGTQRRLTLGLARGPNRRRERPTQPIGAAVFGPGNQKGAVGAGGSVPGPGSWQAGSMSDGDAEVRGPTSSW